MSDDDRFAKAAGREVGNSLVTSFLRFFGGDAAVERAKAKAAADEAVSAPREPVMQALPPTPPTVADIAAMAKQAIIHATRPAAAVCSPNAIAEGIWTAAIGATQDLALPGGAAVWAAQALYAAAGGTNEAQLVLLMLAAKIEQGSNATAADIAEMLPPTEPVSMPRGVLPPQAPAQPQACVVPNTPRSRPKQPGERAPLQPPTATKARWTPRVIQGGLGSVPQHGSHDDGADAAATTDPELA